MNDHIDLGGEPILDFVTGREPASFRLEVRSLRDDSAHIGLRRRDYFDRPPRHSLLLCVPTTPRADRARDRLVIRGEQEACHAFSERKYARRFTIERGSLP